MDYTYQLPKSIIQSNSMQPLTKRPVSILWNQKSVHLIRQATKANATNWKKKKLGRYTSQNPTYGSWLTPDKTPNFGFHSFSRIYISSSTLTITSLQQTISELPLVCFSKWVLVSLLSYARRSQSNKTEPKTNRTQSNPIVRLKFDWFGNRT